MRFKLNSERKAEITSALIGFYASEFDETLSPFQAEAIIGFLILRIGPSQYNQAITDACKYMAQKVEDLDTEFFEPEE